MSIRTLRTFILNNTHLVQAFPEQKLHLITPRSPLWTTTDSTIEPYYGFLWPGGYGLTRFIYDNPTRFQGKSCLEIGSGCGSASIAALQVGATSMIANDIDPSAGVALELNAEANGQVMPAFTARNYLAEGLDRELFEFDVVMFGDMLYEDAKIYDALKRHKGQVFFADPERHVLREVMKTSPKELRVVAAYPLPHGELDICQCNTGFSHTNVYTFV